ncbi:hypothetical protein GCM10009687_63820 [Asanoa iriomotensis]
MDPRLISAVTANSKAVVRHSRARSPEAGGRRRAPGGPTVPRPTHVFIDRVRAEDIDTRYPAEPRPRRYRTPRVNGQGRSRAFEHRIADLLGTATDARCHWSPLRVNDQGGCPQL